MTDVDATGRPNDWPLSPEEYLRYGRQMIMPEWGLGGQLSILKARVAVVGAGGLGCPVLQYLAGAGVGSISIIDHDTVSVSNLHRQVLHSTERVGMNKAESAKLSLKAINPNVEVNPHPEAIFPSTAAKLLEGHDIVIDCTDRPYTRYLISDACVLLGIPLVSGAAIGAAGQWAVYGGESGGSSQRCDEAGVWGPVTGMVGSGMAAAALATLMRSEQRQQLHILHLGGSPMVRSVKMRPPSPKCVACGRDATITDLEKVDYGAVCSVGQEPDEVTGTVPGGEGERVTAKDLQSLLGSVLVIDTRPEVEYGICALPHTTNIPLANVLSSPESLPAAERTIFLCRRGNDSQLAAAKVRSSRSQVQDVRGGLTAWTRDVDSTFPIY